MRARLGWRSIGLSVLAVPLTVFAVVGVMNAVNMIDGMGGMWCVNVGYGRDEIADAMAAQAKRMCYYSPFTKNSTESINHQR